MLDQNIIPSAPQLYPTLPDNVSDFRLKNICDCQKELENEISHYKKVCKKYKRAKSIAYTTSSVTGLSAAVLTSSGLAVSLSGIGIILGAPLAAVAALMGSVSSGFIIGSKKFDKKITKHEKTISLAEAKHLSISKLISKALNDRLISDSEFNSILREVEQYHSLKDRLRSRVRSETRNGEKVDVEALKEEIKKEY